MVAFAPESGAQRTFLQEGSLGPPYGLLQGSLASLESTPPREGNVVARYPYLRTLGRALGDQAGVQREGVQCRDNRSGCMMFVACTTSFIVGIVLLVSCVDTCIEDHRVLSERSGELAGNVRIDWMHRLAHSKMSAMCRRGLACMIPGTKEFFISLSDHSEWGTAHTCWGEVSAQHSASHLFKKAPLSRATSCRHCSATVSSAETECLLKE